MAYIADYRFAPIAAGVPAAATSVTIPIPPYKTDDIIFIVLSARNSGATLAIPGYTQVGSTVTGDASVVGVFWKKATSTTTADSSVTNTATGSSTWQAHCYVFREADTTTPIDSYASAYRTYPTWTAASPALTTGTDNCLVMHICQYDLSDITVAPADLPVLVRTPDSMVSGPRLQSVAGAIPTFNYTASNASNGAVVWAIAIKNAASGNPPIITADGRTLLKTYGGFETSTWSNPDSVTGLTTINSLAMSSGASTIGLDTTPTASLWRIPGTSISSSENLTPSRKWVGAFDAISANLSGKTVFFKWGIGNLWDTARIGPEGAIIVFVDSSNNWAAYQLRTFDQGAVQLGYTRYITVGVTTAYATGGTIDWTAIVKVGYFYDRMTGSAAAAYIVAGVLGYENAPTVFTGGSADVPVSLSKIEPYQSAIGVYKQANSFQGTGQLVSLGSLQFGDGTLKTYAKTTAQGFEFPSSSDYEWGTGAGYSSITLYGSADCTFDFSSSLLITQRLQNFAIHASSSTSATYNFVGFSVIGWAVTWKTGVPCDGVSFKRCDKIDAKGATFTNVTIADTISTDAAISFTESGGSMASSTIDVTGTSADYHIELGTAVTAITLADVTFTGTPGTDKVHVLKTTGTVTITISGTTSLVAGDVTSAGATVDIIAPVEYQSVTLSNYTTGSRIQIYDTTNSVELYNDIPAAAPQTLWTDSVAASTSGARDIRVRCAYVSGVTAKNFIEAAIGTVAASGAGIALSYRVNQSDDHVYVANGVDGSLVTGITIVEGATDRVQISIAGGSVTWPQIYAYQCYWLFDVTGITDDGAFINAPDTANYTLTGFKIKNTHATNALVITGGYGVDSTGSASVLYDTTGTSIFPAPAHVVPYQTTGTYAITGDISTVLAAIPSDTDNAAAVLAAAQTTPIHSDVRKVVGITVDGTGTDGDPWGPV